ncbi:putative Metal dependent phosphohydrolase [Candidatus Zixiibacteriota bacterium]|nr:putative Metal dependent phosphohydrolase [candidate division Zixibacteria bacterium]
MQTAKLEKEQLELAGPDEQQFINSMFVLFKTAQYVEPNNTSFLTQSSKFYVSFRRLADLNGKISIKSIEGRIFVGDKLVKFDSDGLVRARSVMDQWHELGVGGVILDDSLDNRQLDKFMHLLATLKLQTRDAQAIAQRLTELGIEGITLLAIEERAPLKLLSEEKRTVMRRTARANFFRAISVVEDVMVKAAADREVDLGRAKRVVHSLIDQISEDESSLIELTSIRDFDEYTFAHCTNVCVYSLTIGSRLGMDRQRLSQLGFAALFHDIGKVKLPGDLIRKPDTFDENDWLQMQKHPQLGAKTILRNLRFEPHVARAAIGAFEHHINEDFTGYPALKYRKPTNLFSKIISIADTFDALTSGRVYIKKSIPPDEVLRKMMYQMTVKFDAFLLKLFVGIVGIFPAGTMVLLSSEELAVVAINNPADLSHPIVRLVGNRDGIFPTYPEIDLAAPENANRRVVRIIDPKKYNIDIKSIILSDK